jgi:protein-S-isoprenylcysteine O-methyltransferase Ste14
MQYDEGAAVMAKWPGSSLFFKATVRYVRDDDNEYDVEYENGTVYTIKAKDVYSQESSVLKKTATSTRARSRSRGRSPGRGRAAAKKEEVKTVDSTDSPKETAAPKKVEKQAPKAVEKPKLKVETPTRISARIAAKVDAYSDDESEKVKLAPNPELPDARGRRKGWNLEWMYAILFMVLPPAILITLHTLCNTGCKLAMPKFSKDLSAYVDPKSIGLMCAFGALTDVLSYLPVGRVVNGRRMNGFISLVLMMLAVPVLIHFKVPIGIVNEKYFTLMTSCIICTVMFSVVTYAVAKWKGVHNLNPKGNTGNPLVDMFNGVEMNPVHFNMDFKLNTLRFSMMTLAMLNVLMVSDSIVSTGGKVAPQLVLAAAFQIMFAMDALFFEEYFSLSHDAMNTGYGWSLISSYCTFPFLPTLVTRYLLTATTPMTWYYLVGIGLLNALGYVIYRSSETQRCEFAKNPSNPSLAHLETLVGGGNKKLVVSGWNGLVRHPNYLGEILVSWSWVLPAAGSLGAHTLVPYYLPVITTVLLLVRAHQINIKNKRKYGAAWTSYTENVKYNILPYVY